MVSIEKKIVLNVKKMNEDAIMGGRFIVNINTGGCLIETEEQLEIDKKYELSVRVSKHQPAINIYGTVLKKYEIPETKEGVDLAGYAIGFSEEENEKLNVKVGQIFRVLPESV